VFVEETAPRVLVDVTIALSPMLQLIYVECVEGTASPA